FSERRRNAPAGQEKEQAARPLAETDGLVGHPLPAKVGIDVPSLAFGHGLLVLFVKPANPRAWASSLGANRPPLPLFLVCMIVPHYGAAFRSVQSWGRPGSRP